MLPKPRTLSHIPVYTPGKSESDVMAEYNLDQVIKLASNENPLGSSPRALDAVRSMLETCHRYPDQHSRMLKKTLAGLHRIPESRILVSSGLEEMIACIGRAYLTPQDTSIMPENSFIKYGISVHLQDARAVHVPMKEDCIDLQGMLDRIERNTKIIWIASPNNPTGTYINEASLKWFLSSVPDNILVVLDEAYRDFADAPDYHHRTEHYHKQYPNLVILRTFSKAYGLANLRTGYAIGMQELLEPILQVREIFSVTSIAEAAACAALEDTDFVRRCRDLVIGEKARMYPKLDTLAAVGLRYRKSQANFIYIETDLDSGTLFTELQRRGVIIRPVGPKAVRVTIGTPEENSVFLKECAEVLAQHAK